MEDHLEMSANINKGRQRNVLLSPYFKTESHLLTSACDVISSSKNKGKNISLLSTRNGSTSKSLSLVESNREDPRLGLPFSFFNTPCIELAKALLGKILVRKMLNGVLLKGIIVETESYLGGLDKASISYGGKITEKSKPMYMKPGTTFVYITYGMYNLINISSYGKF